MWIGKFHTQLNCIADVCLLYDNFLYGISSKATSYTTRIARLFYLRSRNICMKNRKVHTVVLNIYLYIVLVFNIYIPVSTSIFVCCHVPQYNFCYFRTRTIGVNFPRIHKYCIILLIHYVQKYVHSDKHNLNNSLVPLHGVRCSFQIDNDNN